MPLENPENIAPVGPPPSAAHADDGVAFIESHAEAIGFTGYLTMNVTK